MDCHPGCDLLALPLSLCKCQTLFPALLLSASPTSRLSSPRRPSHPCSFWRRQQPHGLPGVSDLYSEHLGPCLMVPSLKRTRPPSHPSGPAAGGGVGATSCRTLVACQCRRPSLPGGARPGCVLPSKGCSGAAFRRQSPPLSPPAASYATQRSPRPHSQERLS